MGVIMNLSPIEISYEDMVEEIKEMEEAITNANFY